MRKIFQENLSLKIDSSKEWRYTRNIQEVYKTSSETRRNHEKSELKISWRDYSCILLSYQSDLEMIHRSFFNPRKKFKKRMMRSNIFNEYSDEFTKSLIDTIDSFCPATNWESLEMRVYCISKIFLQENQSSKILLRTSTSPETSRSPSKLWRTSPPHQKTFNLKLNGFFNSLLHSLFLWFYESVWHTFSIFSSRKSTKYLEMRNWSFASFFWFC